MPSSEPVVVCCLGRVAYRPAWALQEAIKDRLIQSKEAKSSPSHVLLHLEHPPIYTMGKSGNNRHLPSSDNAEIVHIDRGGDVTYHGPGQLVVYFLLDLNRFYRDLHRFMRDLEEIILRTLSEFNITGFRVPGRTGVWVGPQGEERKICAFGIHASRWVTTHGLALNVDPDLSYFSRIIPCGITDRGITSLSRELGRNCDIRQVSDLVVKYFDEVFGTKSQVLRSTNAYTYLEQLTRQDNLAEFLSV